ncbi:MAG: ATP-binding protein [Marinicella sp.]
MQITSIKTKILMLLLTITCVVVISMALLMQFGFKQGFNQYKKSLEKDLNDRVVTALEAHYSENQSWQLFSDDPRAWHELIFVSSTDRRSEGKPPGRKKQNNKSGQRPPPKKRPDRGPPDHLNPNKHEPPGGRRMRNPELSSVLPSYSLFNQNQELIIGQAHWADNDSVKIAIKYQNDVVGYVVYDQHAEPQIKQDKQFNETFVMLLIMITGVMILVAVLFTFPAAKYFTRPISALNTATKKAAGGDFTVRINIDRNDELGQLSQNFNSLTSTLASNAEIQKRMMADISHELRTPVAVLLAQIEAIQDGIHHADEKSLELLHNQTNALRHLINDIHQLSVTDLGSMQYQMRVIDIQVILAMAIEPFELSLAEKNITLEKASKTEPLLVLGDKNRLLQMFTNLLSNSINYTQSGGTIKIKSWEECDWCVVQIDDSPPGLFPHEIEQMFDRLYRADGSRNKQFGGSGLGLAIVQNIVDAHQGQILAQVSDLGGIRMIVRIPKHV